MPRCQRIAQFLTVTVLAATMLAATVLTTGSESAAAAEARPNIIVLESDDHHFQALGCLGENLRTPHLDALAARGALFTNNVCQGTACAPSRNSLLTGSYPHNTGVYDNRDGTMREGIWTFPAALGRAGYFTALVGKNHFKPHSQSTDRPAGRSSADTLADTRTLGFEYIHSVSGKVTAASARPYVPGADAYRDYLQELGLLEPLVADYRDNRGGNRGAYTGASVLPEEHYQDTYIANQAKKFLDGYEDQRPFFLWVDFVAPHPPADAPEPYASMYAAADMRLPMASPEELAAMPKSRLLSAEEFQTFRAGYYAMITLLDAQVGRLVKTLEERGLLDNTLIVFAGDQGSMLGDHGLWGKGVFYKGSINSPLIIAGPGVKPGTRVDRPVQLLDVAPTLLEVGGASADDRSQCQGESLLPLLTGEGTYQRQAAFAEEYRTKMVATETWKYVNDPTNPQLFYLKQDPDETRNLAGQRPEVEQRMQAMIKRWLADTQPVLEPNE